MNKIYIYLRVFGVHVRGDQLKEASARSRTRPFHGGPPRISEPQISIYVSYFEYDFTYVMSKGKKKMEIYGSDIRGGSSMKGGPLNGWKLPSINDDDREARVRAVTAVIRQRVRARYTIIIVDASSACFFFITHARGPRFRNIRLSAHISDCKKSGRNLCRSVRTRKYRAFLRRRDRRKYGFCLLVGRGR